MLINRADTVVHPKVAIFALVGPIVIGMNCILEEGTILVNRYDYAIYLPSSLINLEGEGTS